jgi:hypothetical protein
MRKCIASQEMKPKKEMIRVVRNKEGVVTLDPTGKQNGRGAYISLDPELVKKAHQKDMLSQALNATVSDEFYEELLAYAEHQKARAELQQNG